MPQVQPGEGVARVRGDDYVASLLALPGPVGRRSPSASTASSTSRRPASDHVLFSRRAGDRERRRNGAHDAAELARAAKRPLSTDVFEWTPTGWEVLDLAKAR